MDAPTPHANAVRPFPSRGPKCRAALFSHCPECCASATCECRAALPSGGPKCRVSVRFHADADNTGTCQEECAFLPSFLLRCDYADQAQQLRQTFPTKRNERPLIPCKAVHLPTLRACNSRLPTLPSPRPTTLNFEHNDVTDSPPQRETRGHLSRARPSIFRISVLPPAITNVTTVAASKDNYQAQWIHWVSSPKINENNN